MRNAVLSGLGRSQYISIDGSFLHFARVPLDPAVGDVDIPYEQFEVRAVVADHVILDGTENDWRQKGPAQTSRTPDSPHLFFEESYDRVIVLWLDEDRLAVPLTSPPLKNVPAVPYRIDAIIAHLLTSQEAIDQCNLKIIGPTNSDRLETWLETNSQFMPQRMCATILSARATVAPAALRVAINHAPQISAAQGGQNPMTPQAAESTSVSITSPEARYSWRLERTIPTDDQMAEAILDELDRRNLRFPSGHSPPNPNAKKEVTRHVAIVAEWDSLYSRSLARYLTCRLAGKTVANLESDREAWVANPTYVHEFSYLRGLDGEIGGGHKRAKDSGKPDDQKKAGGNQTNPDELERPEGQSQFDYLRRLTDRLEALDSQLRRNRDHPSQIGAIGILGSDVYDKLLVMRALKKRFRQAVFFTVGLDALYLNEQEHSWTRNLIVASPFGFTTGEVIQDRIPPFRDSYQTALFLSTLKAINLTQVSWMDSNGKTHQTPFTTKSAPRLFEIGSNKLHDISVPVPQGSHNSAHHHDEPEDVSNAPLHPEVLLLHPPASTWFHRAALLALFIGLLLWFRPALTLHCLLCALTLSAMIGCLAVQEQALDDPHNHGFWKVSAAVGILIFLAKILTLFRAGISTTHRILFIAFLTGWLAPVIWGNTRLLTAIHFVINHHGEERFAWFEGVSVWPTDFIRFAASICSLSFILLTWKTLQRQKHDIEKTFFQNVASPPPDVAPISGVKAVWVRFTHWIWLCQPKSSSDAEAEKHLWLGYLSAASCAPRIVRLIFYVAVYFLVIRLALKVGGLADQPFVPVRGEVSRALDNGFMWGAVMTYTVLLFYVFDVTFLASSFLRGLTRYIPKKNTALKECEAMHLINKLASTVSRLVYFPFTALFMMIAARNSLFDAWDWPPLLLCVFGLGLLIIIITTVLLQREARRAREDSFDFIDDSLRESLERIRDYHARRDTSDTPDTPDASDDTRPHFPIPSATDENYLARHEARVEFLRERRKQIESYNGAVFQPWHRNPIFTAILIPVGGLGSIQALEQIIRFIPN
ncbi:MAG: hypothetical protein QM760_14175 [Nibricoccus sp.]